jgi:hypothetical protein
MINTKRSGDRIYRVVTTLLNKSDGEISRKTPGVPPPLPAAMQRDFAQVEKTAAILGIGGAQFIFQKKISGKKKDLKKKVDWFGQKPGSLRYLILNGSMETRSL